MGSLRTLIGSIALVGAVFGFFLAALSCTHADWTLAGACAAFGLASSLLCADILVMAP